MSVKVLAMLLDPDINGQRPISQTLGDQVFVDIFNLILDGSLPLGSPVNEVALAQRLGVSRGPVREAVHRLQGLRLVEKQSFLRARVIAPTSTDLIEIFRLREVVEGLSSRLAAERLPATEVDEMISRLEADRDARQAGRRPEAPFDIHHALARRCGNGRVERVLCEDLHYPVQVFRVRARMAPGRQDQAFDEHWQILRAVRAGDGLLAESLMRAHIAAATETLSRTLAGLSPHAAKPHDAEPHDAEPRYGSAA